MDHRQARAIYQVLIEECAAPADDFSVDSFIFNHRDGSQVEEYRFMGNLGFGGKFWQRRMAVSCYPEDTTPEREASMERANARLAVLHRLQIAYTERIRAAGLDRTVHGKTADGREIVRYDRAGKWYLESPIDARVAIALADAVRLATDGSAYLDRPGGLQFDAQVQRLNAEMHPW